MFREISVHPDDCDLLRYIVQNEQGQLEDWHTSRVTIGVTSSPFLATASLRQVAIDHAEQHVTAGLVPVKFYVDDFLHIGKLTCTITDKIQLNFKRYL